MVLLLVDTPYKFREIDNWILSLPRTIQHHLYSISKQWIVIQLHPHTPIWYWNAAGRVAAWFSSTASRFAAAEVMSYCCGTEWRKTCHRRRVVSLALLFISQVIFLCGLWQNISNEVAVVSRRWEREKWRAAGGYCACIMMRTFIISNSTLLFYWSKKMESSPKIQCQV